MKKFFYTSCMAAIFALSAGCETERNYAIAARSWKGESSNALTRIWGHPDRVRYHKNGSKLYIYRSLEHHRVEPSVEPGYTRIEKKSDSEKIIYTVPPVYKPGYSYDLYCTTWFSIDLNNLVFDVYFKGNNCMASDHFVTRYANPKMLPMIRGQH